MGRLVFYDEQHLAELYRRSVLDQNTHYGAGDFRLDLIHHFHCFDDAERVADRNFGANLDEGFRGWRRTGVEGSYHRRSYFLATT